MVQTQRLMKKLIRSQITKAFLTKEEQWTTDPHEAWTFETDEEALAVAQRLQLQNFELWYSFNDRQRSHS